jgi:nucleotide-binding universal stress UspA family protein
MYRSILVPLDGSTFAEHALPVALGLARRAKAQLHLVSVSTPLAEAYVEGLYFSTLELEEELTARHQTYLNTTAARLRERAEVPVTTAVLHGEVAATLCDQLSHGAGDLVVMATHGRGALGRFWLGSVADEMVRHTSVPLLLVRPGEEEPDLSKEPALTKIVLPLDGSELAEQILEPAIDVASVTPGAEIILMRAIRSVVPVSTAPDVPEAEKEARTILHQIQDLQGHLRQEAEQYLFLVAERIRGRGLRVETQVIVEDQPAVAILREAEQVNAGLIALETHGRRGLSRLILGSVADKVIRGAHIPVLVHRPKSS